MDAAILWPVHLDQVAVDLCIVVHHRGSDAVGRAFDTQAEHNSMRGAPVINLLHKRFSDKTYISHGPMRLIIVCGNEDCRKEYNTDTNDRVRECPHCGRKTDNVYYPFLSAKLMQSRIDGDQGDWESVYDETFEKALVKVQERMLRVRRLESDVDVPEEERYGDPIKDIEALKNEDPGEPAEWRSRLEAFIRDARDVILPLEDRIVELEKVKEDRRSKAKGEK
jgi:hypothetical protein